MAQGVPEGISLHLSPSGGDPSGSFHGEGVELSWKGWQGLLQITRGCRQEGTQVLVASVESELLVLAEPRMDMKVSVLLLLLLAAAWTGSQGMSCKYQQGDFPSELSQLLL